MKLLITCPFWLSSILSSELKFFGYQSYDNFPTWIFCDWDISSIYSINIKSRIANKVYLSLWQASVDTFDKLFDFVNWLPFAQYIQAGQKISVTASSKNSKLSSTPSIQSIVTKSIIKNITNADWSQWYENPQQSEFEIYVFIQDDLCQIFLNTSWNSLHQRWYRKQTLEAPIKENVAAWLILLSWRKFRSNFYDPFCWSWTMCIEAAMIAKNIPPGINRNFAFQSSPDFDPSLFSQIKEDCNAKIFKDKKYQIFGSDIDSPSIDIAIQNAKNAWVYDTIKFETKDFFSLSELSWHMLSNPPYGKRLQDFDLNQIYSHIDKLFSNPDLTGWFITSYEEFSTIAQNHYKNRLVFNWADKCTFYTKVHNAWY